MKILAVGDPHGDLEKVKEIPLKGIDLILLTGDIGKADLARKFEIQNLIRRDKGLKEIKPSVNYTKKSTKEIYNSVMGILRYLIKYSSVYGITGNVWMTDKWTRQDEKKFEIRLPHLHEDFRKLKNFHLVRNSIRNINGLKIGFLEYFTDISWVKEFKPKDYEKRMKRAIKKTEKARRILGRFGESGVDILLCHQPPYGFLDENNFSGAPAHWKGKHAGSKTILDYIKRYQPKYVFCGHIHEGKGKVKIGKTEVYNLGVAGYKIVSFD